MSKVHNLPGRAFKFRPKYTPFMYIFMIALAIFILGVQIGIRHGRELQIEDIRIQYGIEFTD